MGMGQLGALVVGTLVPKGERLPGTRPARTPRATFLVTIPTSARDLPSDGEGPPNRP